MAQTKTKSSAKRSQGAKKPPTRSRSSSNKKASSSKKTNSASRSSNRKSSSRSSKSSNKPAPIAAAENAAGKATNAVGNATGKATNAVGNATGKATTAVGKAKVPLLAGGAALAGAAGGLALGSRQARRGKGIGKVIPRRPRVKIRSRDVATAAKEVGTFGAQLGQLANELQRTRESSNGKHRSPLEVVLEGLTARRSRA
jgi:uncharacterized protein YjbJ (UPF0337 family)